MDDNGYDISDYYHIDPCFGIDCDMDDLIQEARKRDIKIVMDLVINHCSDQHKWFQKAKADPECDYARYFYIKEGVSGGPPNNWRSIFGGSAWEPIEGSTYYYLHLFSKKQVDLNWENAKLREEIYSMINWWLDKGIAGFRLDAITYLKKVEGLPSFEADGADGLVSVSHGSLNRKGIEVFLKELKERTYGRCHAMTIGEAIGIPEEEFMHFISEEDGYFSMIFDFSFCDLNLNPPNNFWYEIKEWTPDELKDRMFHSHRLADEEGWLRVCMENHDQPHWIDHYLPPEGRNYYGATMLAAMFLMLRGTPYIYQGQELVMRNCAFTSIDDYDDCSTKNQYHRAVQEGYNREEAMRFIHAQSRDNARRPFQWDDSDYAGFTAGTPWIKVNENYKEVNARREQLDSHSVLAWYKELIALRRYSKYSKILTEGSMIPVFCDVENLVGYKRVQKEDCLTVLCNYQNREQKINLGKPIKMVIKGKYSMGQIYGNLIRLRPYEAIILEMRATAENKSKAGVEVYEKST